MRNYFLYPFIGLLFFSTSIAAQVAVDVENVLDDLLLVSQRYVAPAADASVYQSSSAWFSSARGLDKFQFDVSLHFNALPIPSSQTSYQIRNSEFNNFTIQGGATSATVPTAIGGDTEVFYDFTIDGESYEMQAFEGAKQEVLLHPYLQASVGLWAETDLTIRYSPKIVINESDYSILGGAIKHNFSQYFRSNEASTNIEIAGLVSYSVFDLNLIFDDLALSSSSGGDPLAVLNEITIGSQAWLFQIIGSKRMNHWEVNAALAYTLSQVDYAIGGEGGSFVNLLNTALSVLEESRNGFKGDVGLNYYFGKFYLSGTASIGKFTNTNLGLHYKF